MTQTLPADWSVTTLGECADWYSGGTPRTEVAEYWDGDIPWITASSLHDFYVEDSERRVTQLGIENGTRLMPKDTILFVVRGMSLKTEFRAGIARRPVTFGQDCKAIAVRSPRATPSHPTPHCRHSLCTGRQDRTEPPDQRHAGSHGAGHLQGMVCPKREC